MSETMYQCRDCGAQFELAVIDPNRPDEPACPVCGSSRGIVQSRPAEDNALPKFLSQRDLRERKRSCRRSI